MKNTLFSKILYGLVLGFLLAVQACSDKDSDNKPQVIKAAGNIQAAMDEFRTLLGANNGNASGSQTTGRREINWDGVPDSLASPYHFIGDFFNDPYYSLTRGIEFSTPGSALNVSADGSNPTSTPTSFGNFNPTYTNIFPPFSGERIFSPSGSNIADIRFYIPGTNTPAVVQGFGAVYIDVDLEENGAFEFFDIHENSLGVYSTPVLNEGHVFLAVLFDSPVVHHIRIEYGNSTLGPNDGGAVDVSVMDDFIFGEPQEAN
jgi:hypothetical protein